jgi:hypothetical protein
MKKKMIHQLPILLAKPASIDHYHTSPAKIVNGGDLASSSYPSKKGHSRRSLGPPNAFPRKGEGPMRRKHLVVRAHLEGTFARRNPPQFVLPNPSKLKRIQAAIKRSQNLHLPIMNQMSKYNVPLDSTIGTIHIICNGRLPKTGDAKQTKKCIFERTLATPNILPKTNLRANPRVKSKVPLKITPPHTNKLPKPHPMELSNITRAPTTPRRPILSHQNRSPPDLHPRELD